MTASGNSIRKTGPRTKGGKAAAKMNAIAHGVTALTVPPAEQPAYRAHRQGIVEAYQPANAVEEFLCDRVSLLMWRIRRLDAWEAFQLERARREALNHATYHGTEKPSALDALEYRDPARRFVHVRPEVLTMEQVRVEIERLTEEDAWRYLRDAESVDELEQDGQRRMAASDAQGQLSDPPTLEEVRKLGGGDELNDPLLGMVFDLHDALMAWEVEPRDVARAVLGRKPTAEEAETMADPTEWEWQADHLVKLWQLVDKAATKADEGKSAHRVIFDSAMVQLRDGVRLVGIAQRVRLLLADAERTGLVLNDQVELKQHRYDANLERSLFKAMHELEALQEKRRGGAAPLARVEVHGNERGV